MEIAIESADGYYYILDTEASVEVPDPAAGAAGAAISEAEGALCISTFGSWETVEIIGGLRHSRFVLFDDSGWEAVLEAEIETTGALAVVDAEFEAPGEASRLDTRAGRYGVQVFARSKEFVAKHGLSGGDPPVEQHMISVWPT